MKVLALVGRTVAPAFQLSGMEVLSPEDIPTLKSKFAQALNRRDLAMLVISARFAQNLKKEIEIHRSSRNPLIILEISSSQGSYRAGYKLFTHINKVLGQREM